MTKIADVRRANLRALVEKYGQTELAQMLRQSGPSYLGQVLKGTRTLGEKAAREIERKVGLREFALDQAPGEALPFTNVDRKLIARSVLAVGAAYERAGIKPDPQKLAELTALVYEQAVKSGGTIDPDHISSIIDLLK